MKKIITLSILLFTLVSCWNEIEKEVNNKIEEKKEIVLKTNSDNINTNSGWELTIWDIKNNLTKLKSVEIDTVDLDMINSNIELLYNNKVELEALKSNDIKICDKINDEGSNDSCKKRFFIAANDVKSCDLLKATDMQGVCKNSIIEKIASKSLNEELCEKMTFQKQENPNLEEELVLENWKVEIQNCKNRVLIEKAISKKDSNICNNISQENERNNCEELVKMEIENWEINELPIIENVNTGTNTNNTNFEF